MQKEEQKKILWLTGLNEVAGSFIGIFFLFFVQKNFGLELWQILLWFASLQLFFGVFIYPVNRLGLKHIGIVGMIALGLAFKAIFYLMLALNLSSLSMFWLLNLSFLLQLLLFFPSFNYLSTLATQNESRGNFFGNLKAIIIGINVVMPALVGYLFDLGQQNKILWLAVLFFMISIYLAMRLEAPKDVSLPGWEESQKAFRIFLKGDRFIGFVPDVMSVFMWVVWPLYFQFIVGKFVIMGIITGFVAVIEVMTSKFFGKLTDRYSPKVVLHYSAWLRMIDLNLRAIYLLFAPTWFVAIIQSVGSILGPIYQIPYEARIYEVGEEMTEPKNLFNYFVIRESFLGLGRGAILIMSAGIVYYWGAWSMGVLIALSGVFALGARKL